MSGLVRENKGSATNHWQPEEKGDSPVSGWQKLLIGVIVVAMINLLLVGVFSDNGLIELNHSGNERLEILEKNRRLADENLRLLRAIRRLKSDPAYVEEVARRELGMIGENQVILKLQSTNPGK
jgi:cell division protein FtsB